MDLLSLPGSVAGSHKSIGSLHKNTKCAVGGIPIREAIHACLSGSKRDRISA
jgi:hypothetical protein